SGGLTLAIDFLTAAHSYVYGMALTGTARALRPVPLPGDGRIDGAAAGAGSAPGYQGRAGGATAGPSVGRATLPIAGTYTLLPCGVITVALPAGASGTLGLRFGTNDFWAYTSRPTPLAMRVLDAGGHLLRKAVGLTYSGNGLQPLWVEITGGKSVTLSLEL